MATRRKRKKQSSLMKYHIHDDSKVSCVVCLANGVSRSIKLLIPMHIKIRDKYIEVYNSGKLRQMLPSNELSMDELVSSINSHIEMLAINTLNNIFDFASYALMVRLIIEKLALLNFVIGDLDRQVKLSAMYKRSTFDISVIAKQLDDSDSILESWREDNNWTRSDMISRIDALGVEDAKIVYAYTSRIAHATNRDTSIRSIYDVYHIKAYMLIVVSKLYNATYLKLYDPVDDISLSVRQMHERIIEGLDEIWNNLEINPRDALKLTTFVHYYSKKSKLEGDFLTKYKNDLRASGSFEECRPVEYIDQLR